MFEVMISGDNAYIDEIIEWCEASFGSQGLLWWCERYNRYRDEWVFVFSRRSEHAMFVLAWAHSEPAT